MTNANVMWAVGRVCDFRCEGVVAREGVRCSLQRSTTGAVISG